MVPSQTGPILGIDISKKTFDAALLIADTVKRKKFSNHIEGFEQLREWLQRLGVFNSHACMEATSRYHEPLAEFLLTAGHLVSVVNPIKIKGFARSELLRSKTDKIDAALIARFCAAHNPAVWQPLAAEVREVQEIERYIGALKDMKQQEKNRLEAGISSGAVKNAIQGHIDQIDAEIAGLEESLKDHVRKHKRLSDQVELITSIVGIGQTTAWVWLGEMGYSDCFKYSRQAEAFAGLVTMKNQSGTSIRGRDRLSKVGNSSLRKALYMPALVAIQHNPLIKRFAARLEQRGKPKMVIIGAVMRKLLRMIFAVVKSGVPFDPAHVPTYCTH